MTQALNLTQPLTDDERKKVQNYAESLIANRGPSEGKSAPKYVDVDALLGMFAGMGGDKSDKQLIREAWDEISAKYDD